MIVACCTQRIRISKASSSEAPPVANPNIPNASSSAAETPHSDASGSRGKSALDERKEELILSNIKRSRGWPKSCGFQCDNQFELIEELKKKIAPRPIPRLMGLGNTKVTSKMDGAEGNLTIVPIEKGGRQEYSTGIRDPPG
ncbi:hypothetical protein KY290_007623 [Solanum tuberosum]|uniref:Uncharacterized protein n=1 Tax=Solanum tuberosum TaxID=4113 RepID=A0ABQ7W639_SOLTU|nr:hypothetical protein KY290_007623 [Solanum tuberosum]